MNHTPATKRLLAKFGDLTEWRWSGEYSEGATECDCGQPIETAYTWVHPDGRKIITGSTCVKRIAGLHPESLNGIRRKAYELRKARKKALNPGRPMEPIREGPTLPDVRDWRRRYASPNEMRDHLLKRISKFFEKMSDAKLRPAYEPYAAHMRRLDAGVFHCRKASDLVWYEDEINRVAQSLRENTHH